MLIAGQEAGQESVPSRHMHRAHTPAMVAKPHYTRWKLAMQGDAILEIVNGDSGLLGLVAHYIAVAA
jgi:hypothetical protein